jgi:hypothetical protein
MIYFKQLVQDVIEGKESPYKALFILKKEYKLLKEMIEVVEIEGFNQCEYEDGTFNKDGFEITKRNGSRRFDFSNCNSYRIANDNLKEIKNDLKASYSANEKGLQLINEDAEVVELPIVTYGKDSLLIKKYNNDECI